MQHFHFRVLNFPLNDGYQRLVTSFQFRWSNFFKCIERSCSAPKLDKLARLWKNHFPTQFGSDQCLHAFNRHIVPWNPFVSSHHCRPWIFSEPNQPCDRVPPSFMVSFHSWPFNGHKLRVKVSNLKTCHIQSPKISGEGSKSTSKNATSSHPHSHSWP